MGQARRAEEGPALHQRAQSSGGSTVSVPRREPQLKTPRCPKSAPSTEALYSKLLKMRFLYGGGGGNRTRVREPSAVRPTCLARPFESRLATAGRRAVAWPAASTDPPGQAARPGGEADVNDAAPGLRPA